MKIKVYSGTYSVKDCENHIKSLCTKHDIGIVFKKFPKGYCGKHFYKNRKTPSTIVIGPITGPVSYFKAMYHVAHCVTAKCHRGTLLHRKAEAWKWVVNNSIIGINEKTREIIIKHLRRSLEWVLDENSRREKDKKEIPPINTEMDSFLEENSPINRRFKLPPENSIFWTMIRYGDPRNHEQNIEIRNAHSESGK